MGLAKQCGQTARGLGRARLLTRLTQQGLASLGDSAGFKASSKGSNQGQRSKLIRPFRTVLQSQCYKELVL